MKNLFYQLTGLIVGLVLGLSVAATALVTALLWMYYSVTKDSPSTDTKIRPTPRDEDIPLFDRVWANRADAEDFVRSINGLIVKRGSFSLADLKGMIGRHEPIHEDQYWGWTSIHGTTYWPLTSGGVKVRLPKIERIME